MKDFLYSVFHSFIPQSILNLNLGGLFRGSFYGREGGGKITTLSKTLYSYARNLKFGKKVHIHM